MSPEVAQRLLDALGAARLIERYTREQTREGYLGDEWFQSAAERQLEVIGEAFNQAYKLDPHVEQSIPEFRGWIGMRNILAHAYQDLKPAVIWDTIAREVPALAIALDLLLNPSDEGERSQPDSDG